MRSPPPWQALRPFLWVSLHPSVAQTTAAAKPGRRFAHAQWPSGIGRHILRPLAGRNASPGGSYGRSANKGPDEGPTNPPLPSTTHGAVLFDSLQLLLLPTSRTGRGQPDDRKSARSDNAPGLSRCRLPDNILNAVCRSQDGAKI